MFTFNRISLAPGTSVHDQRVPATAIIGEGDELGKTINYRQTFCTYSAVASNGPFLRVVRGLRSYNITGISDALRRENGLREAFQGLKMRIPACLDPWGGRRGSKRQNRSLEGLMGDRNKAFIPLS